ncbi:hydroxymethylglutaryl-CoA lyase [Rathayibacter sp. VKM Ac-2760]|uniref:hydroxymethylglutaryl-CoA lyase n=1 Tax=Rathayibacter sp. VKM Ac-2760 TaxID=2609253 RepID=UPI00244AAC95|nr:hydroxymethylglutaryl-CoA lyase [Rathayibacter sp. VKM Ac-2760]
MTALALNGRGIDRAIEAGVREIEIVASASTGHSTANAGKSTEAALDDLERAVHRHQGSGVQFVAGISTAFVCPFEGDVPAERVVHLAEWFARMGVTMVGLADTLGTATPDLVLDTTRRVREALPHLDYSLHLHNAHGRALETVLTAVEDGIVRFDAALAGYGGCPFAPGAAGNLDTLELVRHLHGAGHDTGIDVTRLAEVTAQARTVVHSSPPIAA